MSAQENSPSNNSEGAAAKGSELFISYNLSDRTLVQDVERLLRERKIETFLDRYKLDRGMPWVSALQSAIGRARAVAVFLGRDGLGTWQKREMEAALDRQTKEEKSGARFPVIPVLLPGAEIETAPAFLLLNTWVDLRARLDDHAELDAIARTVRGQEPEELPASARPALCPYKALRAFREEDALLFFGREAFAAELLKKTLSHSLVAVVGASGSGKSSVVQAGLLPLLRRQHPPADTWESVVFTPGKRPFHNLSAVLVPIWERKASETERLREAAGLGKDLAEERVSIEDAVNKALEKLRETEEADRLLLIVDQFEELFTLTPESDRKRFVDSLLQAAAATKATVLLTLRADFYGQAISLSRELSDLIQQGLVNLGPMTRDELQQAIERPAHAVKLEFQDGLVNRILENVVDQPGSLPLLEFALTELWNNRRGNLLTNAAYDEIGGVDGAIAKRAETQFNSLSKEQQGFMLRFLSRLVRVASAGEEGSDTRQRINLKDFDDRTRSIAQTFVNARLLMMSRNEPTNEETVEVTHEALIRRWPLLHNLIDTDRDFLLWRQRLIILFGEWQRTKQDKGALLRGAQLEEASKWLKERGGDLNEPEREFISASSKLKVRSSRARFGAEAAAILILLIGGATYFGLMSWDRSASRQISTIMENAPRVVSSLDAGKMDSIKHWMRALVRTGNTERAIEISNGITDPKEKAIVFTAIATELAKTGDVNAAKKVAAQALEVVEQINVKDDKAQNFSAIAEEFDKAKLSDEAVTAARNAFKNSDMVYDNTISVLIRNGKSEEALEGARKSKAGNIDLLIEAAVELLKIKQQIKASETIDEALEAAQQARTSDDINDLYYQLGTFNQSAAVLAQIGRIDKALELARNTSSQVKKAATRKDKGELLARFASRADTTKAFTAIAVALAKEGKLDQAFNLVRQEVESSNQTNVQGIVAEALADAGKIEDARNAAREGLTSLTSFTEGETEKDRLETEANRFSYDLLQILCKLGMTEEALNENIRLRKIKVDTAYTDRVGYAFVNIDGNFQTIAESLAKNGDAERALTVARDIDDSQKRGKAFSSVALILLKAGNKDAASRAATAALEIIGKIQDTSTRINSLADVLPVLIGVGRDSEAEEAALKIYKEAETFKGTEEASSGLYNLAAKALAQVGEYYEALTSADKCNSARDKLDAYTSILVEYYKRQNPELEKALEPEEQ